MGRQLRRAVLVGLGALLVLSGAVVLGRQWVHPPPPPAASRANAQRPHPDREAATTPGGAPTNAALVDVALQNTVGGSDLPIGWLSVPALGLKDVPIFDRGLNSRREMLIAPGYSVTHYHYSGGLAGQSNSVIFGHDDIEGGVFGQLPRLKAGDVVSLRTETGAVAVYRVTRAPVFVKPDALNILDASLSPRLTLFTCYPLWVDDHRVVVVAEQAS